MLGLMHDVSAFHDATGTPNKWYEGTKIPGPDRVQLRAALILEECLETIDAIKEGNLVAIADGLADSIYVLVGTALEYGIPLHKVWDAVQEANMAKVDPTTGKVLRREDGKVLKPEGWTPPDIAGILRAYGAELD